MRGSNYAYIFPFVRQNFSINVNKMTGNLIKSSSVQLMREVQLMLVMVLYFRWHYSSLQKCCHTHLVFYDVIRLGVN